MVAVAPDLTMGDLRSGEDENLFSPVAYGIEELVAVRGSLASTTAAG